MYQKYTISWSLVIKLHLIWDKPNNKQLDNLSCQQLNQMYLYLLRVSNTFQNAITFVIQNQKAEKQVILMNKCLKFSVKFTPTENKCSQQPMYFLFILEELKTM